MSDKQMVQNVKVGIFVVLALTVLTVAVLVIGQERSMFTSKTRLYTSFADINGLVVGAPVRLAGVDVGRVSAITFSDKLEHTEARVELSIENKYMTRVRRDSQAFIDSKGLLGDKLINVSVGSPKQPMLKAGEYVPPKQSMSLEAMVKNLEQTAASIGRAADRAESAVNGIASKEVIDNITRTTGAIASITNAIANGDGLAHHLIYDPVYAKQAAGILANLEQISANTNAATARIDRVIAHVEQGPGTLHALAYGDDGTQALRELKRAAAGVAELTDQLNHGQGLAGAILRDDQGQKLVHDLSEFMARLNRVTSNMERGRGTLGALLVDPSVYEDMKTILGNIERNVVFKSLVRMTIKEDGIRRPARQAEVVPSALR